MDTPVDIDKVKAQIRKFSDNMRIKWKSDTFRNSGMILGYMDDPEPVY